MRIGELANNMMILARTQNQFMMQYQKAQKEISTGKRVNTAADNPIAIGQIQRTKALINETEITQNALGSVKLRNQAMETTLTQMGEISNDLYSLSIQYNGISPEKETLEAQAIALLDEMVSMQESTRFNGTNPFSDNSYSVRLSSGSTLTLNNPSFSITKNEAEPSNYDITLNDGTKVTNQSVQDILNSEFIQNNLSNQISSARTTIGINDRILDSRMKIEAVNEELLTGLLSRLEDADLAKSSVDVNIAGQMINLNQGLLYTASGQLQGQIGSIFNFVV